MVTPHLGGGDTRVKTIKSDSDSDSDEQKKSPGFSGKKRGVTPPVAAPGVTHPSDATGWGKIILCGYSSGCLLSESDRHKQKPPRHITLLNNHPLQQCTVLLPEMFYC